MEATKSCEGILLVNKPQGKTSFSLIRQLRKLTGIRKIGHAGTLDPFARGVMVILIGKNYTRISDSLLLQEKQYLAKVSLGVTTDTYDTEGKIVANSKKVPTIDEVHEVLSFFQGQIEQIPPMYSAKKVRGKKLYELAREGIEIERAPAKITLSTTFIDYTYPYLTLDITCSKGTYIRSIAHEIGEKLGCGAHLSELTRLKSGHFFLSSCIDGELLEKEDFDITPFLIKQNPHAPAS